MVKVVKKATAGTILAPILINEPTRGKATNAGMSVMLPATAAMIVAINVFSEPSTLFIDAGGTKVSISPMIKIIAIISPIMFPIIPFDFFIASKVFSLFFMRDRIINTMEIPQKDSVNISIMFPLSRVLHSVYNKTIRKSVTKVTLERGPMKNFLTKVNNYSLLKVLPIEFIEECMKKKTMYIKTYNKEEVIHFEGDTCNYIEIILSGFVVIERIDESGNLLTIAEFYPDDMLGGNLAFSKHPNYPMTVTAKTNASLLLIPNALVFTLCSTNTAFLRRYLQYISDHTVLLGDKIKHYVNRSIRECVIAYLKNEYMLQESNRILLQSSKKALADRIGVQRTSLSRELQKMKNEGLIIFDAESITILKQSLVE